MTFIYGRQSRKRKAEGGRRKAEGGGRSLSPLPSPLSPLPSSRRGVLLLVVLALLAIFSLIAVAFVVLTGHAREGAEVIKKIDTVSDPPQKVLQQALMEILRGPTTDAVTGMPNPASIMGAGSLLESMYGSNWITGKVQSAASVSGCPQLVNVFTTSISATELARRGGCVLTITGPKTSKCYGQSTRIVAISLGTSPANFQVMAFPDGSVPQANDQFLINGVPFSGTGFGYNSISQQLNLKAAWDSTSHKWAIDSAGTATGSMSVALLPNLPMYIYSSTQYNPPGGVNADYTAADLQHMLLAAQVPNSPVPGGIKILQTLPSLLRPALFGTGETQRAPRKTRLPPMNSAPL